MELSFEVSPEQLLRALLQLSAEEKLRVAEQLKAAAAAEKLPGKNASFTVLKTSDYLTEERETGMRQLIQFINESSFPVVQKIEIPNREERNARH
ncbi:MAG: hypothetical protein IPJ82_24105 [Lewinellaceae bacterium]|nr:hypothetical protein [Lewinellaceae bacterium]